MTAPRLAVLVQLALCAAAGAQQEIPAIRETVDVTVANVDVVVTDAAGNRVRGLTREDFELLEAGKPKRITNFAEYDATTPARQAPLRTEVTALPDELGSDVLPRRVVVFWDLSTTNTLQRKRIAAAIDPLFDDLTSKDEVMVVSWNRSLTVEVPPTRDVNAVREGVRRLVRSAALERSAQHLSGLCDKSFYKRAYRLLIEDHQKRVGALTTVLARFMPIKGRKVLVLISEGFVAEPGSEMLLCPETREGSKEEEPGSSVRRLDAATSRSLDRLSEDLTEVQGSQDLMKNLARTANAAGITIYGIHGAGLTAPSLVEASSVDTDRIRSEHVNNSIRGMRALAEESGGLLAANTNDFLAATREIAADLDSFYSIGYRIDDEFREGDRRIEIRMRNPDLTARTRRAVSIRAPETDVRDAVLASLEFGGASSDLQISATPAKTIRPARNRFLIPVDIRIPLEPLLFTETDGAFVANLGIFVAINDKDDAPTEVKRLDESVVLTRSEIENVRGAYYTYRLSLEFRSRTAAARVGIGVLDLDSKLSGFTVVEIPPDSEPGSPHPGGLRGRTRH